LVLFHERFALRRVGCPAIPHHLYTHTHQAESYGLPYSAVNAQDLNPQPLFVLLFCASANVPYERWTSGYPPQITMSFAIEVPGETVPLSLFDLGRTLEAAAASTDRAQRQAAGQQLQAWESHPDYFPALQVRGHGRAGSVGVHGH
jgi:hypothetical protein